MKVGTAYLQIRARLDKLDKDLTDARNLSERRAKETQKRIANVFKATVGLFAAKFTFNAIKDGFDKATDAARDFQETFSKTNQIFGGREGNALLEWAEKADVAMGLSSQAALEATANLGNMYKQLGTSAPQAANLSKEMVQLAADIASFHNVAGGAEQVLLAMQSAFRGEYDALQRYIPTINAAAVQQQALADTGKENVKELTFLEKALASQKIILRDAGDAAGDFARTSGNLANQERILESRIENLTQKIGAGLLPVKLLVIDSLNNWYTANQDLIEQGMLEWADKLSTAAEKIPGKIDDIATSVENLYSVYELIPKELVSAAGYGIIGRILFGVGPAKIIFSLTLINELLKNFNRDLGSLSSDWQKALEHFEKMGEVLKGKRDWWTGEEKARPGEITPHEQWRLRQAQPPPVAEMPVMPTVTVRPQPEVKAPEVKAPSAPEITDFWELPSLENFVRMNEEHIEYLQQRWQDFADYQSGLDMWEAGRMTLEDFKNLYVDHVQYMQDRYEAFIDAQAALDPWESGRMSLEDFMGEYSLYDERMQQIQQDLIERSEQSAAAMRSAVSGWAHHFGSELTEAVFGAELSFGKILESFLKMITEMIIQTEIIQPLLSGMFGGGGFGGGGWFGTLFSGLKGIFGFDQGGYIGEPVHGIGASSGKSYEFHPNEIVLPKSKLQKAETPDRESGGPSGRSQPIINQNFYVSAVDGRSVADFFERNKRLMADSVASAIEESGSICAAYRGLIY